MILEHLQYMTNVNIDVEPEHEDLPSFYWLPKLHKNPYAKRFIAASNKFNTKSLSKLLTTCLAKIICHFREYCNGIYNRRQGLTVSGLSTIRSRFLIGYVKQIIFLRLNILIALIFLLYILASHMIH